jgi:hypothetical protein
MLGRLASTYEKTHRKEKEIRAAATIPTAARSNAQRK